MGNIIPIEKAFIENFEFKGANHEFDKILFFFEYIYGGADGKAQVILKEYFTDFIFKDEFEIGRDEIENVDKISDYFNRPIYEITFQDLENYLSSDTYKKYCCEYSVLKIINEYKNDLKSLKNVPILYDDDQKFYKPTEFIAEKKFKYKERHV